MKSERSFERRWLFIAGVKLPLVRLLACGQRYKLTSPLALPHLKDTCIPDLESEGFSSLVPCELFIYIHIYL